jgi:hypothetical protein
MSLCGGVGRADSSSFVIFTGAESATSTEDRAPGKVVDLPQSTDKRRRHAV